MKEYNYTKQKAILNVLGRLAWGDSIPAVFGGRDGYGLSFFMPSQNRGKIKRFLQRAEYKGCVKPAPDFKADEIMPINPDDYTACVQFNYGEDNNSCVQILLWER